MNYLKLDNEGGVLIFQEVLAFMQSAYTAAISNICSMIGNNVIVEGCLVDGANIGAGTVIINGEVLPFEGGVNTGFVSIVESATAAPYKFGGNKPFYVNRKAAPSVSGIPISNLVRLESIKSHYANNENPHAVTKSQVGLGNLPNEKSDSSNSTRSDVLATSKAVYDGIRKVKGGTWSGALAASTTTDVVVTHDLNLTNYTVMLTNTSPTANPSVTTDVFYVLAGKNDNTFTIRLWAPYATNVAIDYIIFPI